MSETRNLELRRAALELLRPAKGEAGMAFVDRLLERSDVAEVVAALEPEELFSVMLWVGRSDSYEILRYATEEQLQGVMDLDLWQSGSFSPEKFEQFMGIAATTGDETVARVIETLEDSQIGVYLLRRCRVMARLGDPDQEDEIHDMGETILTPDNLFYLILPQGNTWYGSLKSFIDAFYYLDRERILGILASVAGEDGDVLEAEERGFRATRLGSMGFPTLAESQRLFLYANPVKAREKIRSKLDGAAEVQYGSESLLPAIMDFSKSQPKFLRQVLDGIAERGGPVDRVIRGMVALANHVVMYETKDDVGNAEVATAGIERAMRIMGMGLEYVAEGSVEVGELVLQRVTATALFRIGHSLALMVRQKAVEVGAHSGTAAGFYLFDPPLDQCIKAASMDVPMYFEGLRDDDSERIRDFESLAELRRTRAALKQAEGVAEFVTRALALDVARLAKQVDKDFRPLVTHTTLMATALVNGILGVEPWLTPVPAVDIPKVVDLLLIESEGGGRRVNPRFEAAVEQFFNREQNKFAAALMELAVKKLENVFQRLPRGTVPDPRMLADSLLVGRMS